MLQCAEGYDYYYNQHPVDVLVAVVLVAVLVAVVVDGAVAVVNVVVAGIMRPELSLISAIDSRGILHTTGKTNETSPVQSHLEN